MKTKTLHVGRLWHSTEVVPIENVVEYLRYLAALHILNTQ